jgi:hypothetical protein
LYEVVECCKRLSTSAGRTARVEDVKLTRCNEVCEEMVEATELLKLKLGELGEPRLPTPAIF